MSRTPIRTVTVSLDVVERILGLFGTVKNAHRQLGLEGIVEYGHFYRAMQHYPVTPQHKAAIDEAWQRWRYLYLRPEVPLIELLDVNPDNRDADPPWHPGSSTPAMSRKKPAR